MILGIGMVWKGLCYLIVHAWKGLCYVILYKHACILGNTTNLLWLCLWACACTCKERGCIKVYSCVCVCVCFEGIDFFFFFPSWGGRVDEMQFRHVTWIWKKKYDISSNIWQVISHSSNAMLCCKAYLVENEVTCSIIWMIFVLQLANEFYFIYGHFQGSKWNMEGTRFYECLKKTERM